MNLFESRNTQVFNSPLEIGLRSLFILDAIYPRIADLNRLVYFDYLLLHSSDVPGGPESLHPQIPHRSTEILIKRDLLKKGLTLMQSKELVNVHFTPDGILYGATELTKPFLNFYGSEYAKSLAFLSKWVAQSFKDYDDNALAEFITANLDVWGGEFSNESLIRGSNGQ